MLEPIEGFQPHCEVSATLCRFDDHVLFLKTAQGKQYRDLWGLPAGKLDPGESPLEGAIRELREETDIDLSSHHLEFVVTAYVREGLDFLFHLYRCELDVRPSIQLNAREHSEWGWFLMEEAIDLPLIPGARELFQMVL